MDKGNTSFVCELPKVSEPRYICGLLKITRLLFVISNVALIILLLFSTTIGYEFKTLDSNFHYFVYGILIIMLIPILLSFFAIFQAKHTPLIPAIFVQALIIIFYTIMSVFTIYTWFNNDASVIIKKELLNMTYWLIFSILFITFYLYYTVVIIMTYKYLKTNKSTEQFIARQKMFDDVCMEMIEEEEQNLTILRNRQLLHQLSCRYDDSYELSDSLNSYYDFNLTF